MTAPVAGLALPISAVVTEDYDIRFIDANNCLVSYQLANEIAAAANRAPVYDELLALVERYASECGECGGKGYIRHVVTIHRDGYVDHDCNDCADIRAALTKAVDGNEGSGG